MDERDDKAREPDEKVEDLDVSETDSEDVKGGSLNAYISRVQGEKQGAFKGGVIQK